MAGEPAVFMAITGGFVNSTVLKACFDSGGSYYAFHTCKAYAFAFDSGAEEDAAIIFLYFLFVECYVCD
jgi:hypothetical protein